MPRFRKRALVIYAEQWIPAPNASRVHADRLGVRYNGSDGYGPMGLIKTREGPMRVRPGDWIITGVAGERYPCKPDIFAETYEAVED